MCNSFFRVVLWLGGRGASVKDSLEDTRLLLCGGGVGGREGGKGERRGRQEREGAQVCFCSCTGTVTSSP